MRQFHDLFTYEEMEEICGMPLVKGSRHPLWFPLFYKEARSQDALVHSGFQHILLHEQGMAWLRGKRAKLLDRQDPRNASSALAEIRAFGGFLESGLAVTPLPEREGVKTPDFSLDAGDGPVTAEVFSKHQDKEQDYLLEALHSETASHPEVESVTREMKGVRMTTRMAVLAPGGAPDPNKEGDNHQANMISRVCAIKNKEKQLPTDRPVLLVADFCHFGSESFPAIRDANDATPLQAGPGGLTAGPLWYGLYGWKGAPVFQAGWHRLERMGHDGRFRLDGNRKTRISAFLMVLPGSAILLENPWAIHRLPNRMRFALMRFPFMSLPASIADWRPGDAERQVGLQRSMIEEIEAGQDDGDWYPTNAGSMGGRPKG